MGAPLAQSLPGGAATMTRSSLVAKLLAGVAGAATLTSASLATADASTPADTPVDVKIQETPPPRRVVTVEWNPVALITIDRVSFNVVIVPADHHALILSPFYQWATTQPIFVFDQDGAATQLPQQKFYGIGGEIGYRYYTGIGGPRGFFVGPSLILSAMTAKAQDGAKTGYVDYGLAGDVGYELLLADRVAVSVGVGAQFTTPDKSIPNQQFPADIYANSRAFPRALASIGWAF
jgi:hypothetical protein